MYIKGQCRRGGSPLSLRYRAVGAWWQTLVNALQARIAGLTGFIKYARVLNTYDYARGEFIVSTPDIICAVDIIIIIIITILNES